MQQISAIVFDEMPNTSVTELELRGKLEQIPDLSDAIEKFTNLYELVIKNVGLKFVNGEKLAVFEKISKLDMSKNEISYLDADTFKVLTDLEIISLSLNSLGMLPEGIFHSNKK